MYNRKLTVIVGACLLLLGICAANAQDVDKIKYPKLNKLTIPEVDKVTLDNGLRLYLVVDKELPVFNMSVRINAGSYLEPPDKIGLTAVLGDVLRTGGTARWTGDEIDELLEGVGGSVETSSGIVNCGASINVLTEYTDLGLDILAEILRRPAFDEDKIELARVSERSSISRRNDTPFALSIREFRKAIYGPESPYARHTEYATIDAVTRDDLVAFHDAFIRPENIQMAVYGDIDKKEIIQKLKDRFGDWERGSIPVPPPPEVNYESRQQVYYAEKTDVNQTNIFIGHIGGRITDPDYADRIVMNTIMGVGFGSRMVDVVRSREGLAYAAFASYTAGAEYPGIFYNYASTKSETTGKTIEEIIKVVKSMLTDPPTEDELSHGKNSYLNSFVFRFDTKAEVANRIMNYDFNGIPEDFLQQVKEKVENVTAEDIVAAAKNNLHPEALLTMVVGKGEDFEKPLEEMNIGPVDTLNITIPSGETKKELDMSPENLAKGKQILDAAVEAHGGLAAFQAINSVSKTGTLTLVTPNGEFGLQFESLKELPDKARQVVTMMGQKMYDIRNGSEGWSTGPTGELTAKTEDDIVEDDKENARATINIFRHADNPDFQTVFDGSGSSGDEPCDFVVLVDSNGDVICRLGFSSSSHRLISKSYWGKSPLGEGNIEELYGNLSDISGRLLPMEITSNLNGQKVSQTILAGCEINGEIAPDAFSKPQD